VRVNGKGKLMSEFVDKINLLRGEDGSIPLNHDTVLNVMLAFRDADGAQRRDLHLATWLLANMGRAGADSNHPEYRYMLAILHKLKRMDIVKSQRVYEANITIWYLADMEKHDA
jgi:hypothetical protein